MDANLAAQLQFTLDDLNANRAGSLTDFQRRRLRLALLRDVLIYAAGVILPLGLLIILVSDPNFSTSPFILLILLLIAALFGFNIISLQRSTNADLSGRIMVISGKAELHDVGRSLYRLTIDQQSFQISRQAFSAFTEGRFYRVYYTPKLKTILSVELTES